MRLSSHAAGGCRFTDTIAIKTTTLLQPFRETKKLIGYSFYPKLRKKPRSVSYVSYLAEEKTVRSH